MTSPPRAASGRRPGRCLHRPVLAVLLVLLFGGAAGSVDGARPAAAQEAPEAASAGDVRLTVTELTGVLGPGSAPPTSDQMPAQTTVPRELRLRLLVENVSDLRLNTLRVVTEVHPAVTTRAELHDVLDGDLTTRPLTVHSAGLDDGAALAPDHVATFADAFTPDEVAWADGAGGVHPVRIAVTRGLEQLDEVVTSVVWLESAPTSPLLTTLVWPWDSAPWRTAGGAYPDLAGREIRPGGRLDALLTAAERAQGVPLVLAPGAHLLEDLTDRSDGFEVLERRDGGSVETRQVAAEADDAALARQTLRRVRELAAGQMHAPVAGSYADADLSAIASVGGDLRDLGGIAAVEGRRRLALQLGTEIDGSVHLVDGPISPSVLDLLPGDAALLPSRAVDLPDLGSNTSLDEPVRTLRSPSGRLLTALIADPYLEASFAAGAHDAGPVVTVQRTMAESAMAYLVAAETDGRGLVLLPPTTWNPSPRTAAATLEGLQAATWIRLTSPSQLASDARYSGQELELTVPDEGPFQPQLVSALALALRSLESLTAALPDPESRVQGRSVRALQDDLLRATSRWYRGDAIGEAEALVRDVQRTVDTTLGDVEVTTSTVTLTSDTGQIPVTLQRSRGGPLQVVVSVESQGRLLWPEGRRSETLLLPEDGSQTVSFPTRALSTGTFPVTVRVTDPEGRITLANTTMSVRSTAISGAALTGTGLLVAVLLLLGAVRRRDRPTRSLEVVDPPR